MKRPILTPGEEIARITARLTAAQTTIYTIQQAQAAGDPVRLLQAINDSHQRFPAPPPRAVRALARAWAGEREKERA